MNANQLVQNDNIKALLEESGVPCVSILMPMHRLSPERRIDAEFLRKAVIQAKEILLKKYANTDFDLKAIVKHIDELVGKIDYTHSTDGIGIFASLHISQLVKFPFQVNRKVKASLNFDTRDLLYFKDNILEYLVLAANKEHIHLYKGKGEILKEVIDEHFPINYVETYEYARSCRANSFADNAQKGFERDKSELQEIRVIDLLRVADEALAKYVNNYSELIVSGGKKELADYMKITRYKKKIIGKIVGNYGFHGDTQLASLSWKCVQEYANGKKEEQVRALYELIGKKKLAIGLEEVWQAASEGNCQELFVEKDFEHHGFLINEKVDLRLSKPETNKKYLFIDDVVERIIKMVKGKKGKVTFTKNGSLSNFNGIALQLRYPSNV